MKIRNFEHLKELATSENGDMQDFYILLGGGIAKSSKRISFDRKFDQFYIIHEIDESYQEISSQDLKNDPFFKKAIEMECLFLSSE
ncbi:hypothetical protein [Fulvivirga sp.]|uniref:hypothetical protein n=1 Tax=Fulvivirga sp. TaxID=1931237 RepID=UPI0032EC363A